MKLEDLEVFLDLSDLVDGDQSGAVSKAVTQVLAALTKAQITLVAEPSEATHVVVSNEQQAKRLTNLKPGTEVCSILWLCASVDAKQPLPINAHPLYKPFKCAALEGADMQAACISGFSSKDFSRRLAVILLRAMGFLPVLALSLEQLPAVLVVADVSEDSDKIGAARSRGIPVVSLQWVLESLRTSTLLPIEQYEKRDQEPFNYIFYTDNATVGEENGNEDDEATDDDLQPPETMRDLLQATEVQDVVDIDGGNADVVSPNDYNDAETRERQHEEEDEEERATSGGDGATNTMALPPTAAVAYLEDEPEEQHREEEEEGNEQQVEEAPAEEEETAVREQDDEEFADAVEDIELDGSLARENAVALGATVLGPRGTDFSVEKEEKEEDNEEEEAVSDKKQSRVTVKRVSRQAADTLPEEQQEEEEHEDEGVKSRSATPPEGRSHRRKQVVPAKARPLSQELGAFAVEEEKQGAKKRRGRPPKATPNGQVATNPKRTARKRAAPSPPPAAEEEESEEEQQEEERQEEERQEEERQEEEEVVKKGTKKSVIAVVKKPKSPAGKKTKITRHAAVPEAAEQGEEEDIAPRSESPAPATAAAARLTRRSVEGVKDKAPTPKTTSTTKKKAAAKGGRRASSAKKPATVTASNKKRKASGDVVVALSGLHSNQQAELAAKLKKIKVECVVHSQTDTWQTRFTHVVAPGVKRNVKCCAALASGTWILGTSFIDESAAKGRLVDEEDYEIHDAPEIGGGDADLSSHWRARKNLTGHGAFNGLTVAIGTIAQGEAPNKDALTAIIQAGDGEIVPLSSASTKKVDLVVSNADKAGTSTLVQKAIKNGAACVSPRYFIDWLFKPQASLDNHLLVKSKRGTNLKKIENARGDVEQEDLLSPQF